MYPPFKQNLGPAGLTCTERGGTQEGRGRNRGENVGRREKMKCSGSREISMRR